MGFKIKAILLSRNISIKSSLLFNNNDTAFTNRNRYVIQAMIKMFILEILYPTPSI